MDEEEKVVEKENATVAAEGENEGQDQGQGEDRGERANRKILVVGKGTSFSHKLIEYAAWFAKRMEYEMVALTCVPFGRDAPKELSPYTDEIRKRFESGAAKGVELLAYRAEGEGVRFSHVVKYGSPDRCIRELYYELENVEYVLMDPTEGENEREDDDERMSDISVFTYS